jgi:hypothetical protein
VLVLVLGLGLGIVTVLAPVLETGGVHRYTLHTPRNQCACDSSRKRSLVGSRAFPFSSAMLLAILQPSSFVIEGHLPCSSCFGNENESEAERESDDEHEHEHEHDLSYPFRFRGRRGLAGVESLRSRRARLRSRARGVSPVPSVTNSSALRGCPT